MKISWLTAGPSNPLDPAGVVQRPVGVDRYWLLVGDAGAAPASGREQNLCQFWFRYDFLAFPSTV